MPVEKPDESRAAVVSSHDIAAEHPLSLRSISLDDEKKNTFKVNTDAVAASDEESSSDTDGEVIIVTGSDAAKYLLPMRDDFDPALTFRGILLATALTGFQATMNQIYQVCSSRFFQDQCKMLCILTLSCCLV